jgi:hypothetical protein
VKYLFVGGPRHGQFVDVPEGRRTLIVPVTEPITTAAYWGVSPEYFDALFIRTCEYERQDIGTDRLVYTAKRVSPAR